MSQQTEELTLVTEAESAHVDDLPRADAVVIWDDYRAKVMKLKATAETLTVTDAGQKDEMKLARTTRLTLKNVRVEIETRRKELGEEALRRKQKIDAAAKELKDIIEPLETRLLEQEQFAERAEATAKAELKSNREVELASIGVNAALYSLGEMPAADYDALLAGLKAAQEAKIAADKKAEADRIAKEKADAEERERTQLENERLKKEATEREAAAKKERDEAAAEQARLAKLVEDERKEAAAKAAAEKAKVDEAARLAAEKAKKERDAIEAKAKAEKEAADKAREKAEAELAAKKAAEERAKAEKLEAERAAAIAPQKEKMLTFAKEVRILSLKMLATPDNQTVKEVSDKTEQFAAWIEKKAATL